MTQIGDISYCSSQELFTTEYWRTEAERWKASYEAIRGELDEYVAQSQELERELDQELKQGKQQISRLQTDMITLTEANRSLKTEGQKQERRNAQLEVEIQQCTAQRQTLIQQRRALEQTNDEMENKQRILTSSLADQTKRVEELIEAKALLEGELEQIKRRQKETEQRLRDDMKDLRDELAAKSQAAGATRLPEKDANGSRQVSDMPRIIDSETGSRRPATTPATGYCGLDFRSELIISNPPKLRDRTFITTNGAKKPELRNCDKKEAFSTSLIPRVSGLRMTENSKPPGNPASSPRTIQLKK